MTLEKFKKNKMRNKKLTLVLLLFSILCITVSCEDDDPIESISRTVILGKWKLLNTNVNGSDVSLNDCELKKTVEFNASKEVITILYDFNTADICEINSNTTKSYTVEGDRVKITGMAEAVITISGNNRIILTSKENSDTIKHTYLRQ